MIYTSIWRLESTEYVPNTAQFSESGSRVEIKQEKIPAVHHKGKNQEMSSRPHDQNNILDDKIKELACTQEGL